MLINVMSQCWRYNVITPQPLSLNEINNVDTYGFGGWGYNDFTEDNIRYGHERIRAPGESPTRLPGFESTWRVGDGVPPTIDQLDASSFNRMSLNTCENHQMHVGTELVPCVLVVNPAGDDDEVVRRAAVWGDNGTIPHAGMVQHRCIAGRYRVPGDPNSGQIEERLERELTDYWI